MHACICYHGVCERASWFGSGILSVTAASMCSVCRCAMPMIPDGSFRIQRIELFPRLLVPLPASLQPLLLLLLCLCWFSVSSTTSISMTSAAAAAAPTLPRERAFRSCFCLVFSSIWLLFLPEVRSLLVRLACRIISLLPLLLLLELRLSLPLSLPSL